jgi:class 3 adenylate cyclase
MADRIEGATLLELPGADVAPYWDRPELTLDAIEEFVTGVRREAPRKRQLATLVFTDIVDSTKKAEELGDRRWHVLIELHDDTSRDLIERSAGHLVKTTGDGILATFDGPGRAIRSAGILQDELARADLQVRIGIHTGEIEIRDSDIGGIAVHLASRIMDMAGAGEILVSSTVRDLVVGSDLNFDDRGQHALKGIEGTWELYSVV